MQKNWESEIMTKRKALKNKQRNADNVYKSLGE